MVKLRFDHVDNAGFAHFKPVDDARSPGPSVYVSKTFVAEHFGNVPAENATLVIEIRAGG